MSNSMNDLMDLISILCGGYCLYTWFLLAKNKKLFMNGLLMPKDKKPSDCLDEEGYVKYMRPKLFLLGLVIFLFGGRGSGRARVVRNLQFKSNAGLFLKMGASLVLAGGAFFCVSGCKTETDMLH